MTTILTGVDYASLSPLLILLLGALVLLFVESFWEKTAKKVCWIIALVSFIGAAYAVWAAPASNSPLLTPWLRFDSAYHLFAYLFLGIGVATTLLAHAFFTVFEEKYPNLSHGEFYFLIVSAVVGLILIGQSNDFLTLFLGLETLSIALYILCGYVKQWEVSHESSMKYFLMGSLGAAFLLYGIALVYGGVGTTSFTDLLQKYQAIPHDAHSNLFLGGLALITVGLAFKAAVVPFHVWAPDVYDGAPNPVTAFMSVGTKAGAFAAFAVIFLLALPQFHTLWNEAISVLAILTLVYANYVALRQTQLRRFFAYSGISHAGYLLIPLAAGTQDAFPALYYYLVVYGFATLGCFAVLTYLDQTSEGVLLSDLKGLFRRNPIVAGFFALCLLTLAGIPPTAGFLAKFYVLKTGFDAGYYTLVIVALLVTILSAYYYLRIVSIMLADVPEESRSVPLSWPGLVLSILCFAGIVYLSVYPAPLMALLNHTLGGINGSTVNTTQIGSA